MPIGEVFLSASLQVLFDKLASPVISEQGKDELAKLQRTLKRLQAMLHDAEQNKVEGEHFTLWLRELKSAAYDADDVVDEFEYEDLRRKVQSSGEGSGTVTIKSLSRKVCQFFSYLCSPHEVSFHDKVARKIGDIWRRLEEISKDNQLLSIVGNLDVGANQSEIKTQINETSSFLAVPEVFGRDEVKDNLIKLLLGKAGDGASSSSSAVHHTSLSVLSIVGMGGLGKTTLAQWVYNNEEVQEYFHPRMWVCVSQDFNLKKVIKQILEHVVDPPSKFQTVDSLNVLQQKLSEELSGKRFLLILDDVWEEDHKKWDELSAPLLHGDKGSKVLITTRNTNVASTLQPKKIELGVLSFDDCWSIFKQRAFTNANSGKHTILESIGKEIVKKLKGVPLAATTVGCLLGSESEERKWRDVLENELWELQQGGEGILMALRLSYEYLPYHLKSCFAYCSAFRKGQRFDMLELVQLWMAQGFVRPLGKKPMEDVGRDYFNELLNRSLIQFVLDKYVIHDLLHDLGQLILQHDCYHMGPDQVKNIPEDAHSKLHLRLDYKESLGGELEALCKFNRLRTLSFLFFGIPHIEVPFNLFGTVKCLRVLDLSGSSLDILPDSIGCLKHLRFIDLRETKLKCLPESFCALYKLQTLKLEGCNELNTLPDGMSNLISLHYLEAKHELVSKIAKIGKLTHLQNLEVFSVSKENGNRIGNLKNMNELRGKLCIRNLQRVEEREEAFEAALKNKQYLEKLEMEWTDGRDFDQIANYLEESIIEGLQPPLHLKELTVNRYAGINFPSWMNNNSISSLESFHLYGCINLNPFPPLRQLHFLKTLGITSCSQLKELPHLPPALRNLILQDVRLIALPNSLHHLPLQQLVICDILELKELPLLPATLKELMIDGVGLQALPEFHQDYELSTATLGAGDEYERSDNSKPALSILKIHGCPDLNTLHKGLLNHHLRQLQVLSIKDCKELVNWPEGEGFRATLCSLEEEFSIERCPKLNALPEGSELHSSLKKLAVKACPRVPNKSLFSQMHNFGSDNVSVEKWYHNLAHCADEALRHIMTVDWLEIRYLQEDDELGAAADLEEFSPPSSPPVYFVYDREETVRWEDKDNFMSRHVSLQIKGRRRRRGRQADDVDDGATVDDDTYKLLCTCLGGHVWTSSLSWLTLSGIPDRAFTRAQLIRHQKRGPGEEEEEGDEGGDDEALLHYPLRLPSLDTLCIYDCMEMRRLPMEMLLSHLTTLKVLAIDGCSEVTLSSVEEGIRSLPSLEKLVIDRCPKLLMPMLSPLLNSGGSEGSISAPPTLPLPSPLPQLRYLYIDDVRLLTRLLANNSHRGGNTSDDNGRFLRDHLLTSLRFLSISLSELTSMTADEEEGLMTLSSSLQCLQFKDCPNLQNLPSYPTSRC